MANRNKQNEGEIEKEKSLFTEISSKLDEITEKLKKIELKISRQRLKPTRKSEQKKPLDCIQDIAPQLIKIHVLMQNKNKILYIFGFLCAFYLLPLHIIRTEL